jgi:hypothetical protein
MWYYLPEWLKWFKGKPKPTPQEESMSEIIKRRAEQQKAIIDRIPVCENPTPCIEENMNVEPAKVAEKDFFQ